jgi:hypothetical protein
MQASLPGFPINLAIDLKKIVEKSQQHSRRLGTHQGERLLCGSSVQEGEARAAGNEILGVLAELCAAGIQDLRLQHRVSPHKTLAQLLLLRDARDLLCAVPVRRCALNAMHQIDYSTDMRQIRRDCRGGCEHILQSSQLSFQVALPPATPIPLGRLLSFLAPATAEEGMI